MQQRRIGLAVGVGFALALTAAVRAEVITDGSLGAGTTLVGPDYAIGAALGQQVGGNLFHSFSRFNVGLGESATFSGPGSVANIIARVTDGTPSTINGTLRSTIAGADLYLLNRAGVLFGPGAQLDVTGTVHVATADYLGFADGARFATTLAASGSSLSVAAPAAFGFLGPAAGPVAALGPTLAVPAGESIFLVGGDIGLYQTGLTTLAGGGIGLVATASAGEAVIGERVTDTSSFTAFADVEVIGSSVLATGASDRALDVRADDLTVITSTMSSFSDGNLDGAPIDIRLTGDLTAQNASIGSGQFSASGTGVPGDVTISASNMSLVDSTVLSTNFGLSNGADIILVADGRIELRRVADGALAVVSATAGGTGPAGNVGIQAADLELSGTGARVTAQASLTGATANAGAILIDVDRLVMRNGADMAASSFTAGGGGGIVVLAAESVLLTGATVADVGGIPFAFNSEISTSSSGGQAGDLAVVTPLLRLEGGSLNSSTTDGRGGNIVVLVDRLEMTDNGFSGGSISSDVIGDISGVEPTGDAGSVLVTALEAVTMQDGPVPGRFGPGTASIQSSISSDNGGSGNPGQVAVNTPLLVMSGGTSLSSNTLRSGDAGNIQVNAGQVEMSADARITAVSGPDASGDAGSVTVVADRVSLQSGSVISNTTAGTGRGGSISVTAAGDLIFAGTGSSGASGAFSRTFGPQQGGAIRLQGSSVTIANGATINAGSSGGGDAGSITIIGDSVRIDGGTVSTAAAVGGGGNIAIQAGRLVYVDQGRVTTSVAGGSGSGGDIFIDPDFVVLNQATITANAVGGNGGNITIVAGQFLASPDSIVQASSELGIDGTIAIEAPEADVSGGLTELSGKFFDASTIRRQGCAGPARAERQASSLTARGRGALPADGEGSQAMPFLAGRDVTADRPSSTAAAAEAAPAPAVIRIACG